MEYTTVLHLKVTLTGETGRAKPDEVYDAVYLELLGMTFYVEDPEGKRDDMPYIATDVEHIHDRTDGSRS